MSVLSLAIILTLASFAVLSLVAWLVSRGPVGTPGSSASLDARALFARAVFPTIIPLLVAFGMLLPSFLLHEPARDDEWPGAVLLALAFCGTLRIGMVGAQGLRTLRASRALVRAWLRDATPLPDQPWGATASRIDAGFPVVAVAGLFTPRVFVDRRVLDVCSPAELAAVAAHERAHIESRDNLRRLLVAACAGPSSDIAASWRAAAERAADERAVDSPRTAIDLAGALVNIARLAPAPTLPIAALSTIHDGGSLEARVRRLLAATSFGERRGDRSRSTALWAIAVVATLMTVTPLPIALHSALELMVRHLP